MWCPLPFSTLIGSLSRSRKAGERKADFLIIIIIQLLLYIFDIGAADGVLQSAFESELQYITLLPQLPS